MDKRIVFTKVNTAELLDVPELEMNDYAIVFWKKFKVLHTDGL